MASAFERHIGGIGDAALAPASVTPRLVTFDFHYGDRYEWCDYEVTARVSDVVELHEVHAIRAGSIVFGAAISVSAAAGANLTNSDDWLWEQFRTDKWIQERIASAARDAEERERA